MCEHFGVNENPPSLPSSTSERADTTTTPATETHGAVAPTPRPNGGGVVCQGFCPRHPVLNCGADAEAVTGPKDECDCDTEPYCVKREIHHSRASTPAPFVACLLLCWASAVAHRLAQ